MSALALVHLLLFPGLLFTATLGLLASWFDRKLTARVQMRVGPPLLQPFYDVGKLFIKETCVPEGAPLWLFLGAPLLGFASVTLAATILGRALLAPEQAFVGDLFVVIYLLVMPAVAVVLGAASAKNPLASLGGSRELKLLLSYELPLTIAILVPTIQSGSIRLGDLIAAPPAVLSLSGALALIVGLLCLPAKLAVVPFDAPEAETELSGGAYIEYSGPPLAVFRLTRAMMMVTMPAFLAALFVAGADSQPLSLAIVALAVVLMLVIVVLVRNTAPRLRIDQIMKFYWGGVLVVAAAAALLALAGW